MGVYSESEAFKRFRSWVALQRCSVGRNDDKQWKFYDFGPKEAVPLVCIPGVTGTAESFYKQLVSLGPKGYRVISVQAPSYSTHKQWVKGFDRFLDSINADKVHLLGTTLGGYLAQCYIQYRPHRVLSLILSNSFCDISHFVDNAMFQGLFPWMPGFVLKRMLLSNFPQGTLEEEIANSVDFMVERLESLSQLELSSRMALNCSPGPLRPEDLPMSSDRITVIDTMDEVALPDRLREEVLKFYPNSRRALMKSGGNFPFLARPDEFNMYVEVHLRHMKYELEPQPNLAGAALPESSGSLSRNSSSNNIPSLSQQQQQQQTSPSKSSSSSSSTQS